jgi:putative tricarboxylic transport membrane protein
MRQREKITLFIWFLVALLVSIESWRMGLGSLRAPGPGFLTFGVSLIMALLVIILVLKGRREKIVGDVQPLFKGKKVGNIVLGFSLLFAYPLLLDKLGFVPCTMLFMGICLRAIGKKKWSVVVGMSVGIAIFSYFLFDVWLAVQFPKGKWVSMLLSLGVF